MKKKNTEKSKNLKLFLKKYGASPINRDSCQVMLENIISALLSERQDFPLLIYIYMNTTDALVSKCLKKHFILKNKEPKKIENGEGYIKFSIGPSCLVSNDKSYHNFIKGMLQYLELCFDNNYLHQYLQKKYF